MNGSSFVVFGTINILECFKYMEIFPRGIMAEMRTEQPFVYNYHIVLLELSFHTLKQVNNWEKTQTFTLGNEDKKNETLK